jgi:hypothetical protein
MGLILTGLIGGFIFGFLIGPLAWVIGAVMIVMGLINYSKENT